MTLSLYAGAYLVEVFRAGLDAVPRGLIDAGKAIGLTPWQRLLYVRLPTMLRIALPSLSNTFISLFKDTSVASVIAVPELTYGAQWINFNTFRIVEVYLVVTPMYLVTGYAILLGCCACSSAASRCGALTMLGQIALSPALPRPRACCVTLEVSLLVVVLLAGRRRRCSASAWSTARLPLRWPVRVFSDIIRGIPILVLIFFVYYGLPAARAEPQQPSAAAVLALTLFKTAQVIEIVRGAISSIQHGQMEAGKAIGLTFAQRLAYVIFPQALRRFLPPWINGVTDAVKGSALVSLLGIVDLMLAIQQVDRPHLRADAALCPRRAHLLRHQLRLSTPEPAARAPLRLHPGVAIDGAPHEPHRLLSRIRGVTKSFGAVQVLRGVDLDVAQRRGGDRHRPLGQRQDHAAALRQLARDL